MTDAEERELFAMLPELTRTRILAFWDTVVSRLQTKNENFDHALAATLRQRLMADDPDLSMIEGLWLLQDADARPDIKAFTRMIRHNFIAALT